MRTMLLSAAAAVALTAGAAQGQALDLTVGPVVKGQTCPITVTGALPGNRVYISYSTRGSGPTYVPFFDIQIDLSRPVYTVQGNFADDDGVVRFNPWVARNDRFAPPAGSPIWFQALEARPDPQDWTEVVKSNVVESVVEDGDG